ncbi:hypothetical protein NU195Hw_g121t1 [Hortaea werneckii]
MAGTTSTSRPAKRAKLLSDDEPSSSEDEGGRKAGVALPSKPDEAQNGFKINAEYAKRFEHNKKREERHRLEEKFGSGKGKGQNGTGKGGASDEEDEEDSEDEESEDDDAELATEQLDAEIMDTLQAIRRKDPRVYDNSVKFYREFDPEKEGAQKEKKEKPMYLQDYHRANYLAGAAEDETGAEADQPPRTFAQEQEDMRKELVGGMHAAAKDEQKEDGGAAEDDDEDDFLVAKSKPRHDSLPATTTAASGSSAAPQQPNQNKRKRLTDADISTAEKDPETYLSNFMAARAWLPSDGARWQAFDSDDSDDDRRADEFEEAYNMRFEDPSKSNEKLASFARDVGKYGVRREEKSGRAKARERERERKEAEKREREEEKARLRKLKIEEAEEKVNRIRDAAGLRGKDIDLDQWKDIIEGDFDDAQWDQEMQRRFGDQYYAQDEEGGDGSDVEMEDAEGGGGKKKAKKPKWDDDIDIHDLVPDFKDKDENPNITLSDDDEAAGDAEGGAPLPTGEEEVDSDDDDSSAPKKKKKTKKDRQQEKADAKRAARKQRAQIEEMVDASLPLQHPTLSTTTSNKNPGTQSTPSMGFRYRETSPTSFGLSARDILFADDKQLNEFAGLKKFHSFREEEKKARDRKKFSKKARLRQWRRETFGDVEEPTGGFERVLGGDGGGQGVGKGVGGAGKSGKKGKGSLREDAEGVRRAEQDGEGNVREGERKKKRRSGKGKKGKQGAEV